MTIKDTLIEIYAAARAYKDAGFVPWTQITVTLGHTGVVSIGDKAVPPKVVRFPQTARQLLDKIIECNKGTTSNELLGRRNRLVNAMQSDWVPGALEKQQARLARAKARVVLCEAQLQHVMDRARVDVPEEVQSAAGRLVSARKRVVDLTKQVDRLRTLKPTYGHEDLAARIETIDLLLLERKAAHDAFHQWVNS